MEVMRESVNIRYSLSEIIALLRYLSIAMSEVDDKMIRDDIHLHVKKLEAVLNEQNSYNVTK